MAEVGPATAVHDPSNPNLNLTPEEKRIFGQLFQAADTENVGVVTGEVAVKFFEKSRLEPRVLGEIWQIADTENRGFLTPLGFGITLRLIAHVQAGRMPSAELAYKPGPLPRFDGFPIPPTVSGIPQTGGIQPQTTGGPIRVPPLTPEKANEYAGLFERTGAQNSLLSVEQAKQFSGRSGLPAETLTRIWTLADTEQRGSLGVTEFIVGMHLIFSTKIGSLRALPNILPLGLYEAASRRGAPPRSQYHGTSASGSGASIPRQPTGPGSQRAQNLPLRSSYGGSPMASQTTDTDWAITPKDKMQFDGVFASLDRVGRGFITGEEAVGFFGNSKLPEDILAQIWDLADINAEGRLNRDEFAVAMHLIRQQRGSQTDRGSLPVTLPANLIPPSMRHQGRPNLQTAAPAFEIAAQPTAKSATEDLFGLDAFSSASTTQSSPVASKSSVTGNINLPSSPSSVAHVTPFKPFIPSSSFGQNMITANTTGSSTPSGAGVARYDQQASRPAADDDLLGDNDPEVSKKLTAETSELANLSNQVGTLSNQIREVKARRASRNQDLSDAATQKRDFEARLSQLRALYEQEVKEVTQLEYRLNVSRGETRQLQQDMAIIQRTYADLQSQHQQVIAALESDRQENASLKERMRVLNNETSQLRPQLEKIKSDARQQKGLVAINRKQLATNEADHEKVRNEIREATRVVEEAPQSARSMPVPIAPVLNTSTPVMSPVITSPTNQSMNPFFRRSSNTPGDNGARSPYLSGPSTSDSQTQPGASPFDNVFGPPFALPRQLSSPYDAPEHDPVIHHQADTSGPSVRSSEGTEIATPPSSAPASTKRDSPQPIEPPIIIQSRPSTTTLLASREAPHEDVPVTGLHTAGSTSRDHSRDSSNASGGGEGGAMIPSSMLTAHAIEPSLSGSSAKDTTRRPDALASEKSDSFKSFKADDIPGAFPEVVMPGSQQPTPTGNSAFKEVSMDHKRSLTQHAQVSQGDSNTLGTERSPQSVGAQDDFEAAFANMGPAKMHQARSNTGDSASSIGVAEGQRFNKEFPPIEEFGADEESDSQDEHGFDDNFTSSSSRKGVTTLGGVQHATSPQPPTPFGNEAARTQEPSGALSAAVRSSTNPMSQSEVDPSPTAGKQRPPPTYNGTAEPLPVNAVLPGLSGGHNLLSSSSTEDGPWQAEPQSLSKSPPPPLKNAQMAMAPFDTFHSAASTPIVDSSNVGTGTQAPQHSLFRDDFDDAFADLDDAKEADDKSEVDLASSTLQMNNLDEFNPVFDSPAPSHSQTIRSLLPTSPGSSTRPAGAFSDFEPHLGAASESLSPSATGGSHDWDAIFAGLGTSGAPSMTGAAQLPGVPPKEPVRYPVGLGQAPSPFDGPSGLFSHSATSDGIDASTAQRPMVGRALTGRSEHDDPILKKLTGMGYPRDAALDALERYDYNITKAADHLVQNVQQQ